MIKKRQGYRILICLLGIVAMQLAIEEYRLCNLVYAVRIKDIAAFKGIRTNQLVGYGLVVGLNGTGDKGGAEFTIQSMVSMMERMGIQLDKTQLKVKNVAAVMVTADMPPFARTGSKLDIVVSSIGDAKSLAGGTLLLTPLRGVNNKVYALAQGPIAVGGIGASGAGGGTSVNHLLSARVVNAATIEREVPITLNKKKKLTLSLFQPDFTTVQRIADTINASIGSLVATAIDAGAINLDIPENIQSNVPKLIADIENLHVVPDTRAKIVVNEKTGTVVIGENVSISTVAVAHGNLSITITETPQVSQPPALTEGQTVTTPQTNIEIKQDQVSLMVVPGGSTIGDLVRALNAIGVSPRDLISIFQAIKAAGALQAEIEII
ncbi:MAG: flagellar basal body P-ring protein FlgI [Desulfobacterales bacterium]|nr:flagellar basal body P-ring protein FlgI [Desulfobacterales bacterium]